METLNKIGFTPDTWMKPADSPEEAWFPFFTVDFKAPSSAGGNLWVAANQCANASAGNVRQIEHVIEAMCGHSTDRLIIESLCYSLAVDNNLAQPYISWRDGTTSNTYGQLLESFVLSSPERLNELQITVNKIINWGQGRGLSRWWDIKAALQIIKGNMGKEKEKEKKKPAKAAKPAKTAKPAKASPGRRAKKPRVK